MITLANSVYGKDIHIFMWNHLLFIINICGFQKMFFSQCFLRKPLESLGKFMRKSLNKDNSLKNNALKLWKMCKKLLKGKKKVSSSRNFPRFKNKSSQKH